MSPGVEKGIQLAQQRTSWGGGDRKEYLIKTKSLLAGGEVRRKERDSSAWKSGGGKRHDFASRKCRGP